MTVNMYLSACDQKHFLCRLKLYHAKKNSSGMALPTPYYSPDEEDERPFICSLPQDNGIMSCSDIPVRREGGRNCCLDVEDALHWQALGMAAEPIFNASAGAVPGLCVNWNRYYTRCLTGYKNPHKGAINFDNIGYAWIVIFQVITLEGWVEIMYYVMDAHSFYNFIYFILLIIVGSFFMINLCLVVIATQFSETKQREHQLMQEQRAACLSSSTLASLAEPGDCYEELFQLACHILRKARRRSAALFRAFRRRPRDLSPTRPQKTPHCPHHQTSDHAPPEGSAALPVTPSSEECPDCTKALMLTDGTGPVGTSASEEAEDGAEQKTDEQADQSEEKKEKGACKGKCKELWIEMRIKLWGIVESKYFNRGIMIAILINTISMGIEHHEQPEELTNVLEICNIVFTSMFALEMILKLTAFGCFNYLRNPYNIFDGIIVIISVCEIVGQSDGGLSVLRTFRLLRVLKLVRFMPALRRQLVVLMKTMDNVATFCMLLMLFIFIFSILGMHIFGCKFSLKTDAGDTVPDRKNFDSLLWAIVTVFQILTQEDWNVVLYNGMASTSPLAALYFVALMTFGNYVLFNLLVAILVEGFQAEGDANRSYSDEDGSSYDESEKYKDSLQLSDPKLCSLTPNGHLELSPVGGGRMSFEEESRKSSVTSLGKTSLEQRSFSLRHGRSSLYRHWGRPHPQSAWSRRSSWNSLGRSSRGLTVGGSLRVRGPHSHPAERESLLPPPPQLSHPPPLLSRRLPPRRDRRALSLELPERFQLPGPPLQRPPLTRMKSFGVDHGSGEHQDCNGKTPGLRAPLLSEVYPQLNARKDRPHLDEETDYSLCFRIQKMMEVYRPDWCETRENWSERVFLTISNYIFTAIFVAEMTVKVSSRLHMCRCLSTNANVFFPCIQWLAKALELSFTFCQLLRTLRPLRVISRAPGLKLVVETLITSLKPIGNIVLICCAFFIIFGILGVQLFKGKFYYCVGLDVKNITNKSDCLSAKYKWVHHKYNFDNLGQALMSLFVLASKDGWVNIMYHGLDAVGIDQQPVINNNPWMLLYFISFLLIVSFFVLNMFVGVVVENFHKCRQHQEVEEAKRREEKRLRRMEKKRRKAQKLPYYAGYSHIRLMIHSFCTSHYLDLFITLIICINVVTMSLEHYDQPKSLETGLKYCNYFFSSTFVVEAMLKLIAFGFRRFFKDRWNQLDLAIVLLSVMGITLEEIEINASLPINPTIIRIMRVLRIARVLKLLKMATGMRALLDTVVQALPQVHAGLALFPSFIYHHLTSSFFSLSLYLVCNADHPCEGMSRHATFENFGMAFLTLFQVSTGDNWNGIMKDTLRECPHGNNHSCNASLQFISPMYFVSFVLTAQFVLINVVVAVLMKHLDDSNKEAQEDAEMDAEIELELAQGGLCCLGGLAAAAGPGLGVTSGGGGGGGHESHNHRKLYSPAQENLWLDSVSLLIKDSLEGEMQMIDNLSGSVFHHYSSPAVCRDCKCHPAEIQLAEVEQASLMSEQLSDKSSSPVLPDDLSLDDHSVYQLLPSVGINLTLITPHSTCTLPVQLHMGAMPLRQSMVSCVSLFLCDVSLMVSLTACGVSVADGERCSSSSRGDGRASSPLFHLPAEFFHPATAVPQGSPTAGVALAGRAGSRLNSPASWASLRSPGANTRASSLAMGSSEGSLQTALEKGLSFNVSSPQDLTLPLPLVSPLLDNTLPSPDLSQRLRPAQTGFSLQATRGRQRSQSSCGGSTSPSCNRQDSMDPSDEDTGIGIGEGSSLAFNSEHLSETLSSLSLTSLLTPGSLVPPLVKKCNSTGSLEQGNLSVRNKDGRQFYGMDQHQYLSNPWTEERGGGAGEKGMMGLGLKSSSQTMDAGLRKNR
uniref:Calcium voltage-gated channel subunit alpha1 Ib n=1 Tax=Astyanax mexicanus TaxID=7994 RepID=A0A8B9JYP3_ASTMX